MLEKEPTITIEKAILAETLVTGVQYLSRREVLSDIASEGTMMELSCREPRYADNPIEWMKIEQVGLTPNLSAHMYYTAIQKALFSCHKPDQIQIIFMIHGDGEKINLYIGLKDLYESYGGRADASFTESLSSYLNGLLPGSKVNYLNGIDDVGARLMDDVREKKYRHLYALTGIPSLTANAGEESFSSIDTLIGPLSQKKFVYYVVANPMNELLISQMMTQYLDMAGKIESVKSLNISEATSTTVTIGRSHSLFDTVNASTSDALTKKGNKSHFLGRLLSVAGLGGLVDQTTKTITKGETHGSSTGEQKSDTSGFSQTQTMTLVNKCAEYAARQLTQHADRYKDGLGQGMWETGVYLLTENANMGHCASMQLRSTVSGSKSYLEPIRIHDLSKLLNTKGMSAHMIDALRTFCAPQISIQTLVDSTGKGIAKYNTSNGTQRQTIKANVGRTDESLTTILTTEELSSYINLPQKAVPGISVVDYSENFSLTPQTLRKGKECIPLGKLVYSGTLSSIEVKLPIDTLSRHALVCGVNGSGKTNTVLNILQGFMEVSRPFLVIEPAKTEYVDWAIDYNKTNHDPKKRIKIFIPGCNYYAKKHETPTVLRLNPFEVIDLGNNEPRVLSHIDRLKASFSAAFPMQDILPVVMEHLLYKLYTDVSPMVDKNDPSYMKKGYPMLVHINRPLIKELMLDLGYAIENTQNISAALRTRINSLKYGWKGELLNNERLGGEQGAMTWSDLFDSPCIINLSYAGDDQDRAFIMSLILQFLYEYRIAETETKGYSFNDNICRHIVVVEEAHRVMARCIDPLMPQYRSGQMFSSFLSEVRAYGQGMMVVDQVPSRLIEDAVKNTNVKIIHKLVAADDAQTLGECIGLTLDQQRVIPRLSVGQAILAGVNSGNMVATNSADLYLAQINKKK